MNPALSAPEPLSEWHDLNAFDSGEESLDLWLRRRARSNQVSGASRTFVVPLEGGIAAYYAISAFSIAAAQAPGLFRRNMPDPVRVALLGRLAVGRAWQGRGLGRALVRDCAMRVANAADTLGIRGIVVHAISDQAKAFYLALGFEESPADPMMLLVTLKDVRDLLG